MHALMGICAYLHNYDEGIFDIGTIGILLLLLLLFFGLALLLLFLCRCTIIVDCTNKGRYTVV